MSELVLAVPPPDLAVVSVAVAVAAHNVPREALIARLEDEPTLWVRLAAVLSESVWSLRLLELTVGERPPGWTMRRWAYPEAIFVASTWSGAQVTRWLRTGRAGSRPLVVFVRRGDHCFSRTTGEPMERWQRPHAAALAVRGVATREGVQWRAEPARSARR